MNQAFLKLVQDFVSAVLLVAKTVKRKVIALSAPTILNKFLAPASIIVSLVVFLVNIATLNLQLLNSLITNLTLHHLQVVTRNPQLLTLCVRLIHLMQCLKHAEHAQVIVETVALLVLILIQNVTLVKLVTNLTAGLNV